MNCKQLLGFFALLLIVAAQNAAFAQEDGRMWAPVDGANIRQGTHIEWFRGGEARVEGENAGEAAFIWSDCRFGDRGVFTQMVDVNGNLKFDDGGLLIADSTGRQEDPGIWPDPDGGWFMAWEDFDIWWEGDSARGDSLGDIYCTKIDADGNILWGNNGRGVPVCVFDGTQEDVRIVHDNNGGCIIAWRDMRGGDAGDIYAMRILENGTPDPEWTRNGIPVVAVAGPQTSHTADIDGTGGMIIAWKDGREVGNFDIWAQRISRDSDLLWGDGRGIQVCSHWANQQSPKLCPDGAGGAFFTWVDDRNQDETNKDIYAQRVNRDGGIMWGNANAGSPVCTEQEEQIYNRIVISEPGTAIILWEDKRGNGQEYDLYAMRVTGVNAMEKEWDPDQGRPVVIANRNQSQARLYPDGEGGAFFVWEDERDQGFPEIDIWGQRLNVNGDPMWNRAGIPICAAPLNQNSPLVRTLADGGCTVAWEDLRTGSKHIYAQRLRANGNIVWEENGIPLATGWSGNGTKPKLFPHFNGAGTFALLWMDGRFGGKGTYPFVQFCTDRGDHLRTDLLDQGIPVMTGTIGGGISPDAVVSENGDLIVVWEDHRRDQAYSIYAQRILAEVGPDLGNLLWSEGGIRCAEFRWDQHEPKVCTDGQGGAFIVWKSPTDDDYFDIYMQRLDRFGVPAWGAGGILVTGNFMEETVEKIIYDGEGGAVIVWRPVNVEDDTGDDLWMQRINRAGEKLWGEEGEGIILCNEFYAQNDAQLVRHPEGYVVVWVDSRDDELGQPQDDIYGQFVNPDGSFRWTANGYMICGMEFHQQSPSVAIDEDANIWVAWDDNRFAGNPRSVDIYLQKLSWEADERGRPEILFTENDNPIWDGILICGAVKDQRQPEICHDGQNGMWLIWEDYRIAGVWSDVFAIHLQNNGESFSDAWDEGGNMICSATHKQELPQIGILNDDGTTGVVAVWEDKRATGKDELSNVFVQRVDFGEAGVELESRYAHPTGYILESIFPNPFNSQALITFITPREGEITLSLFDVTGRAVLNLNSGYWSAGRHVVLLDCRTLAAGTYIVQLDVNDISLQRKAHLVK